MRTRRAFKKVTSLVVLGLAAAVLVTAAAAAQVQIEFWHPYGPPWDVSMELAAEAFMEDYPHIQVNVVQVPDLHAKLPVVVAAGTAPDAAHIWGVRRLIEYSGGVLEPLDAYLERIPGWDPADVIPGFLSSMEYNGSIWGMPTSAQPTALVWSRSAFEAAGLAPVEGWADEHLLTEYSIRLTRTSSSGVLEQVGFLPSGIWGGLFNWSYHWGGSFYDPETQRITAAHDANVAALTWISDLYDRYGGAAAVGEWQSQFSGGGNPLYLGKQGMALFSHFHFFQAYDAAPDWEYGFAPPPQMGDAAWQPKGIVTHTDAHVVIRGTEHPFEATLFVWHSTVGEGYLTRSLMRTGHPSASISLNLRALEEDLFPAWMPRELVAQHLQVLLKARDWPKIPVLGPLTDAVNAQMGRVLNKVVSPRAALEEVERTLQAQLEEALAR